MEQPPNDRPDTPEDVQTAARSPVLRRHAQQLLQVVEPVVGVARSFTGFFVSTGVLSMLGAVVLLLILSQSLEETAIWKVALIGVTAVLLFSPGLVLLLFWVGLKQLVAIPDELVETIGQIEERSAVSFAAGSGGASGRGRFGRLVALLRSLVDVRTAVLQSRDVFTRGVVLVRVANPVSLVAVLGATIASFLIVAVATVAALVVLL